MDDHRHGISYGRRIFKFCVYTRFGAECGFLSPWVDTWRIRVYHGGARTGVIHTISMKVRVYCIVHLIHHKALQLLFNMYKGSCSLNSHCRRTSDITTKQVLDSSSSQQTPAYRKQWKPLHVILKQGQVSTTPTSVLCRSCKVHFSVVSCMTLSLPTLVVLERSHGPELL